MTEKSKKLAHLFDATQCVGCSACIVACAQTNYPEMLEGVNEGWNWLPSNIRRISFELAEKPSQLLVQCQECENAPCVSACPVKANYRDENGMVKTDTSKCIGCGLCVKACPYDARWMHPLTRKPVKCMGKGCEERIARGELPACVAACPVHARSFGDVNDPKSEISKRIASSHCVKLMEEKGTKPNFYYVMHK